MANDNKSREWLYKTLDKEGYNVGKDYAEFDSLMSNNADSRKWVFDTMSGLGYNVGKDYDEFEGLVNPLNSKPTDVITSSPSSKLRQAVGRNVAEGIRQAMANKPKPILNPNVPTLDAPQFGKGSFNPYNKGIGGVRNPIMTNPMDSYKQKMESDVESLRNQGVVTKYDDKGNVTQEWGEKPTEDTGFEHYVDENGEYAGAKYVGQEGSLYRKQQEYKQATERPKTDEDIMSYADKIDKQFAEAYKRDRENNASRFYGTAGYYEQGSRLLTPETNNLAAAKAQMDEARNIIEAARRAKGDRNALLGFLEDANISFWKNLTDFDTWDFGLKSLEEAQRVRAILDKFDKGENLSPSEKALLDAVAMNTAAKMYYGSEQGMGETVGATTAQMIPFMIQMAVSPSTGWGKAASSTVLKKLAKYAGKKFLTRAAVRGAQGATRILTDIGAGYVMAGTVGAGRTLADMERRMTGNVDVDPMTFKYAGREKGDDAVTAAAKALTSQAIEYQSEMVGEYFKPLLGMVGKSVTRGVMNGGSQTLKNYLNTGLKAYERMGKTKMAGFFRDLNSLTRYDGAIGEYLEEVVGNIENATSIGDLDFSTDENGVFNLKNNIETFLSVAVPGVAQAAMTRSVDWGVGKYKEKKDEACSKVFGEEVWNQFKPEIDALQLEGSTPEELANAFTKIAKNINPQNREELEALRGYFNAVVVDQAIGMGQQMKEANTQQDIQDVVEGGIEEGREMSTPEDVHENALSVEDATQQLMEFPDGEQLINTVNNLIENGAADGEVANLLNGLPQNEVDAVNQYISAMAQAKGVDLQVDDEIAKAVAAERERLTPFIWHDALDRECFQAALYKGQKGYITNVSEDGAEVSVLMEGESEPQIISANDEDLTKYEPVLLSDYLADYEQQVAAQMTNEVENARVNNPKTNTLPQVGDVISTPDGQQRVAVVTDDYRVLLEPDEYKIDENTGQQVPIHIGKFSGSDLIPYEKFVGMQNEYWDAQDKEARENLAAQEEKEAPAKELGAEEEAKETPAQEEAPATKLQGAEEAVTETQDVEQPQLVEEDDNAMPMVEVKDKKSGEVSEEPDFAKAGVDRSFDYLYNEAGLDRNEANAFVRNGLEQAKAEQKKIEDKKPDIKKYGTNIGKYKKDKADWEAQVDAAKGNVKLWQNILNKANGEAMRVTSNAMPPAAPVEAQQQESVVQPSEQLKPIDLRDKVEVETAKPKRKKLEFDEPVSLRDWIMQALYNKAYRFNWSDSEDGKTKGLGSHLGLKTPGQYFWLQGKDSLSPEKAAERMLNDYATYMGWKGTEGDWAINSMDMLNELLDVLQSYPTQTLLKEAIYKLQGKAVERVNNKMVKAETDPAQEAYENEQKDLWAKDGGFNSYAEYEEYLDMVERSVEPFTAEEYEQNKIDIAERYEEEFVSLQQKEQLNTQDNGETNVQPSEAGVQGRNGLLPEEGSGEANGIEGSADEQREDASLHNQGAGIVSQGEGAGQSVEGSSDALYDRFATLTTAELKRIAKEKEDNAEDLDKLFDEDKEYDIIGYILNERGEKLPQLEETDNKFIEEPIGSTSSEDEIKSEESNVNVNPTDGQKKAGNYKKGHIKVDGFNVTIENPKGSIRRGTDANGREWEQEMHNSYGYIRGTEGVDGDHIDVFLSDYPDEGYIYVIDQVNPDGTFDEHKVMYGFDSVDDAMDAYLSNYEQGWQGLGAISRIERKDFKKWIDSSDRKTKPFSEYHNINKESYIGYGRGIKQNEPLSETDPVKRAQQIVERESLSALIPRRDIATDDVFKANHSEEEQERMRYVEGETFEDYCKRNDLKPTDKDAQFYFFQKYADRWGDIEKALDGIDEDPRAVGFAVGQMVDSVAEGYEMLQLLQNINPESVLPFYDGVFDGYEEAHWDEEAKLQKAEANTKKPSKVEKQLRDYVVNLLRGMGIEVSTDAKEGQKVLDSVNGEARLQKRLSALVKASNTIKRWLSNDSRGKVFTIELPVATLDKIRKAMGRDFDSHNITANGIVHGLLNHGENGKKLTENSIPVRKEDAELIPYIMTAPDEVVKGSTDITGRESIRFYKNLSNGYVVVVEKEYKNNPNDMETINIWAELSPSAATNARKNAPDTHVRNAILSTEDAAKIRKDAETAIENDEKIKLHKVFHGSGADFDAFDHSFMGTGEGNQTFGWGTYVTDAEGVGRGYAKRTGDMKVSERRFIEGKIEEARKYNIPAQVEYWENELKEKNLENAQHYLYKVEIPEDDGSNYIDYFGKMQDQQGILDKIDNYMTSNEVYGFKWKRQNPDQRIQFRSGSRLITLTPNQSGADLYEEFKDAFGAKPASEILHAMGITGIKVPVNAMRGGNEKGEMNYVIFNENDARITDKVRFFKTSDGNAYGFTSNGKIYIDPRIAGADTPIHEYAHLWCEMKRKTAPEEWEAIKKAMLDDSAVAPIIERLKKEYPELTEEGREDDFVEEVVTQFSGKRGAERLREVAEEVAKENGGKFTEEQVKTAFQRLKDILNKFWQSVAKMLGIKYRNANDVADMVMSDLLNGKKPESKENRDKEYSEAVENGDTKKERKLVEEAAKDAGYTIRAYHGTARKDRVGNVFRPERATSGPMAFFTDSREIAENYSHGKPDTSIGYDSDYDDYETQFRAKHKKKGKDYAIWDLWGFLPFSERAKLAEQAGHIREDWDGDGDIIYDPETKDANGAFRGQVKDYHGNVLRALVYHWLKSGQLWGKEADFLQVLEKAGVNDALAQLGFEMPRYLDPEYREEGVYDVYLKMENPFDATEMVDEKFIQGFEEFAAEHEDEYVQESKSTDGWDKNDVTAEDFAENMRKDIEDGRTNAWTAIPDVATAYLKSLGFDGIKDKGGKYGGSEHTVYVPFSSEQVKSAALETYDDAGNLIPLSERFDSTKEDIRYQKGSDNLSVEERDKEYADAVAAGDMEKVDAMLREEAARNGYSENSDYQGSLAFNGAAPSKNGYYETKEERKEAFENGELEGEYSLGDFADNGVDGNDLGWQLDNPIPASGRDAATLESIRNLANTVKGKKRTIKMYRAVDADIKEDSFRNGDWVTPSRKYAEQHIGLQNWKKGRIIEQEVPIDDIWWNGDDINEWGYDDGKGYAYKNTSNNRKLMEPTYDEEGNLIPLSQRFNEERDDILFRDAEDIFISNAERAVEGIKQEKATPEQWLKMIEKAGGLKAGEDKWMGLSDWLKENKSKTLTKDEVLDYIRKNKIEIEEVNYTAEDNVDDNSKMIELREEFDKIAEEKSRRLEELEKEMDEANDKMYEKYGEGWANKLEGEDKEYIDRLEDEYAEVNSPYVEAFNEMVDKYGDDFEQGFEVDGGVLNPTYNYYEDGLSSAARYFLDIGENPINETRLNYTTDGLDNKREIALVVPTIESWNEGDEIHFGDAGEGRAVAWVRFGDTTIPVKEKVYKSADELEDPWDNGRGSLLYYPKGMKGGKDYIVYGKKKDGSYGYGVIVNEAGLGIYDTLEEAQEHMNFQYQHHPKEKVTGNKKVLVIDEIQSKRHQEGREKGYKNSEVTEKSESYSKANEALFEYEDELSKKYGGGTWWEKATVEEVQKREKLRGERDNALAEYAEVSKKYGTGQVPDAPFDKNWHELAMKRMLRYAAENGYDKVAWTKGEQQAERYNIGNVVSSIDVTPYEAQSPSESDGHDLVMTLNDGTMHEMFVQPDGTLNADSEMFNGKKASEVFGKGIAEKIMSANEPTEISGDGLRIGSEGMKGFYDQILPRFMDKYGKKWGVKTDEVELPNLEESAQKMWSVDVTPEMKESVMKGQNMFREGNGAVTPAKPVSKQRYTKRQIERANRKATEKFYNTVERMGISDRVHVYESGQAYLESLGKKNPTSVDMRKARSKGWFDPKTKQIYIIVANNRGLNDTMATLLHEGVTHYGLRELVGEERFDQFIDDVYDNAVDEIREKIDALAERLKEKDNGRREDKQYQRVATEEYMAKLAEEMDFDNDSPSGWKATLKAWWYQIKESFFKMMHKLGLGTYDGAWLTDNELRYILWRSWKNMTEPGAYRNPWNVEARAEDRAMQDKLKVGEYAEDYHGLINSKDVVAVNSKPTMLDGYTRGIGVEIDMTKGRHLNLFVNPMSGEVQVMSGTRGFTNGQRMRMEGEYLDNILGQRIANDIMENAVELRKEDAKKAEEMQQDVKKAEKFDIGKVVRMTAVAENDGFAPGVGVTMFMPDGRKLKLWVDTEDEKEDYYGDVDLYGDEWTDEEIERYDGEHISEIVGSKLADEILRNGRNGFELDKKGINKLNGTMLQKAAEEKVEDLTTKGSDFMSDDMKTKVLDAYNMVHDRVPEALAMVQTPYGYVMVNKDAKVMRDMFNLDDKPYVVFPENKMSDVLPVLIRAGYRVAVAETSNNKAAESGVVKESDMPVFREDDIEVFGDKLSETNPVKRAEQRVNQDVLGKIADFINGKYNQAVKLWNDGQYKFAGWLFKQAYGVDNVVVTDKTTIEDLMKKGFSKRNAEMAVEEMRNGGNFAALYFPYSDKIAIFARKNKELSDIRAELIHESVHQYLEHLPNREAVLDEVWEKYSGSQKKLVDILTDKDSPYSAEDAKEEFFAYMMEYALGRGSINSFEKVSDEAYDAIDGYLNTINYGKFKLAKELFGGNKIIGRRGFIKEELEARERIRGGRGDSGTQMAMRDSVRKEVGGRSNEEGVSKGHLEGVGGTVVNDDGEASVEPINFANKLTQARLKAVEENKENLNSKIDAIERVVQQLEEKMRKIKEGMHESPVAKGAVRAATSAQKVYDRSTVMDFVEFAKVVMDAGMFDSASKGEVKRLMNLTKGVVGKEQLEQSLNAVTDLIIDHSMRECKNLLKKQLSTKGTKVDAKGVEVQGKLDIEGQRVMAALKDGMKMDKESLQTRLADAIDRMGSDNEVVANNAASEYQGLMLAKQYLDDIKESEVEESNLKHEFQLAKDSLKEGEIDRQSFKEFEEAFHENIRQIKLERIKAYENLVFAVGGNIARSFEEAKAFKEAEMERIRAIQHNANSDLTGTPATTQSELPWYSKLANAGLVRFFLQPVATFDEMLRFIGKKSVDGKGYLWNRFMTDWTKATNNLWKSTKEAHDELDNKVKEIFAEGTYIGKDGKEHKFPKIQRWSDLFSLERKMEGADVEYWDDGKKTYHLSEGNLLYIYMVNKMNDGKMKLRKMGITEEDVDAIKEHLNPSFIKLADWIQDEFLPKRRVKYNEVYKRMFGADMAAIDNYFPLKIDKKALNKEEDLSAYDGRSDINPSTITGSVIKRTKNASALDLMHADAFDLVLSHLDDMERWAAFAEFNRDLNTLLSYKRFRNQLQNMSSGRFGAGDTLLENFKTVAAIAGGAYRPHVRKDSVDSTMVNLAKGVTAAKISLRVYTALKQLLSYPAYLSEANLMELVKSSNPVGAYKAWNWAMENLPLYAERWQSRQAGDYRLKETDMDWQMWKNDLVRTAARVGMSPNAFVDALTVAMGAKAVYETARKRYLKDGFDAETAKEKAMLDASVAYNETQQSSQSAYMSAMQLDRTAASVALTVFRNASMAYERRMLRALSNMKKRMNPDYKDESKAFMQKMLEREGVNEEEAKKASERMYRRQTWRDMVDVAVFGYILQTAWNLAPYLPYLIAGDDDDEKKKMLEDVLRHAMFGGIEGLTGGSLMSEVGNLAWQIAAEDDDKKVQSLKQRARYQDFNLLPLMSDLQSVMNKSLTGDKSALVDGVNLLLQSGIGVNPQTFSDAVVATIDAFNGDLGAWKEFAYAMARIMQTPSGAMDMLYIDELGMFAHDARKLRMEDLAKRWARYKMMKDNPLLRWAYSEDEEKALEEKLIKRFENKVKERIADMDDEEVERMMIQSRPGMEQEMLEKEMNKRYQKEADELDGEELDNAYDNAVLMPERKILSKDIAKEVGASRDSYGAKPQNEHEALYQDLRTADDVREDAQLLKMQEDAKTAGDEQRVKEISTLRSKVMSARKALGMGNDEAVMNQIRENRKKLIERLEKK